MLIKHKFKSKHEEILFFKSMKPQFTSKLYYHMAIYRIAFQAPLEVHQSSKNIMKLEQANIKISLMKFRFLSILPLRIALS